jgi:hypothetical protein
MSLWHTRAFGEKAQKIMGYLEVGIAVTQMAKQAAEIPGTRGTISQQKKKPIEKWRLAAATF